MRKTKKTELKRRIGGRVYSVQIENVFDDDIGRYSFSLDQGRRAELVIACQVANEAPPSGEGFNWLRRVLGLTGPELGKLLGVRFETISRWERGDVPVDRGAWLLTGGLVLERAGQPVDLLHRMETLPKPTKRKARG